MPGRPFIAIVVVLALAGASPGVASASTPGAPCPLIQVPTASGFAGGTCPGVRPGAAVVSAKGLCTANFVFHGSDGRTYIGTAGHCTLGTGLLVVDAGERSWAPGTGPVAKDGGGHRIGEFAYAVLQRPKDFALVRLDPGVAARADVCHFGGPTALNASSGGPRILSHYGQGVGVGRVLPARTSFAFGSSNPDRTYALGVGVPGDSGSPVLTASGHAYGVLVTLGLTIGSEPGTLGITRIGPQLSRASTVLGTGLTLLTAPRR